jgi:hypothetical protein
MALPRDLAIGVGSSVAGGLIANQLPQSHAKWKVKRRVAKDPKAPVAKADQDPWIPAYTVARVKRPKKQLRREQRKNAAKYGATGAVIGGGLTAMKMRSPLEVAGGAAAGGALGSLAGAVGTHTHEYQMRRIHGLSARPTAPGEPPRIYMRSTKPDEPVSKVVVRTPTRLVRLMADPVKRETEEVRLLGQQMKGRDAFEKPVQVAPRRKHNLTPYGQDLARKQGKGEKVKTALPTPKLMNGHHRLAVAEQEGKRSMLVDYSLRNKGAREVNVIGVRPDGTRYHTKPTNIPKDRTKEVAVTAAAIPTGAAIYGTARHNNKKRVRKGMVTLDGVSVVLEKRDKVKAPKAPPVNHREEMKASVGSGGWAANRAHMRIQRAWKKAERSGGRWSGSAKKQVRERKIWRNATFTPKEQGELAAERARRDLKTPKDVATKTTLAVDHANQTSATRLLAEFDSGKRITPDHLRPTTASQHFSKAKNSSAPLVMAGKAGPVLRVMPGLKGAMIGVPVGGGAVAVLQRKGRQQARDSRAPKRRVALESWGRA